MSGTAGPEDSAAGGGREAGRPDTSGTDDETWPIGFLIIVALAVLYLGWRLVQGVAWLINALL